MNTLSRLLVSTIIAASLSTTDASAHPPGADGQHDDHHHVDPAKIRTWTNAKTGEVVRGAFLASRTVDGVVRVSFERETGDVVIFPLTDLTDADQAEAQRRIDEVKATNERLAEQAALAAISIRATVHKAGYARTGRSVQHLRAVREHALGRSLVVC